MIDNCVCGKIAYPGKGSAILAGKRLQQQWYHRQTEVYRCRQAHPSIVVYHLTSQRSSPKRAA